MTEREKPGIPEGSLLTRLGELFGTINDIRADFADKREIDAEERLGKYLLHQYKLIKELVADAVKNRDLIIGEDIELTKISDVDGDTHSFALYIPKTSSRFTSPIRLEFDERGGELAHMKVTRIFDRVRRTGETGESWREPGQSVDIDFEEGFIKVRMLKETEMMLYPGMSTLAGKLK